MLTPDIGSQFLLSKDVIFLNHGSFGSCPRPVFETYQKWQLELERQPVAFLDQNRDLLSHLEKPRKSLARFLRSSSDDLVRMPNATAGMNVVARSLKLRPGDQILMTDHEYPAVEKLWRHIAKKTGAEIRIARVTLPLRSKSQFKQDIERHFSPYTKILVMSHITSPTALQFPIEEVVQAARKKDILTLIDGAHAPGHINLNLPAIGADFYVGNCHKWMMSPKGAGFLWATKNKQDLLEPLVFSHGWAELDEENLDKTSDRTRFLDGFEIQGTGDPSAWLSVPAAIAFRKDYEWPVLAKKMRQMAVAAAKRVEKLCEVAPLSDASFSAPQMVAMPVSKTDPVELKKFLWEKSNIEIPVFDWQGTTIVRLSIAPYTTPTHIDQLLVALAIYFNNSE